MHNPLAPVSPARRTHFARTALAAAVAIVAAAPAFAQNTTAAVNGRITNPSGAPVAQASVTIVHRESGSSNTVMTDADGVFSARGLRVGGPYTITATHNRQTETRNNVFLTLAESQTVDIVLGPGASTIVVVGRSDANRFNASNQGAGTTLSSRDLAAYASIQRNLQDYARIDPRLAQTDKERGEISAGGQNTRYNSITIDGVTINDTFGLESNNLPTTKQPISIDAIQSVQVNLSNYDVTQKGYTGANINAVTKSGTNEFKGSVYYVFRDDNLVGQRYNRQTGTTFDFLPFKEDTKGFTLGGPIIKDKLFFFASYEELKSNRAQPEFGPSGGALTNVGISNNLIGGLRTIAKNQYGFDVGEVIAPTKLAVKDSLIKLDWNISDNHRANIRWTKTDQEDTNNGAFGNYSVTSLQLTSQWWQQVKSIETVVAQWFADWTPNFSTEVKLSKRDYSSVPLNNARLPAMSFSVAGALPADAAAGTNTGTRFLNYGTEQSRHFNVLETNTTDIYAGGTWTLGGGHELRFGADLSDNKVYNAFFQNTLGNYTFNCTNSSATFTYSFGAITCASATAAQVEAAILENFSKGRPSSYQVQVPVPGGTLDDGIAKWSLKDTGLFLQDTWKVNKQLTLNLGVRVDTLSTNDRPKFNAAAAAATVAGNVNATTGAVTRNTGGFGLDNSQTVDGEQLVQPRVGFNYIFDPKAERKMQMRGGFGLFQGAAANVWLSNPYSNTGLATRIYGCGIAGFTACAATGGVFSANPDAQPRLDGNTPAANVDFIAPGLSQPSVWKANLGFDFDLTNTLVASAEVLYTKNKSGIYYQHLNLGAATRTGPDGRDMFYTPQGYNSACWTATGGTTTTGACTGFRTRALSNANFNNVLLATDSEKGGGNAVTLSLGRPTRDGYGWNVAYTRTEADEVSPLTSSVANSNFNSRAIYNPNENVAARSATLIRDRFSASMNWSKAFIGSYRTQFGVFYEGRTGKPYSWIYRNDLNGDGVVNDLMYIPTGPGSGEVEFRGDTATSKVNEDRFWSIVSQYKELNSSRGKVVSRAGSTSPFVHNFDVRLSQEIPGFTSGQKGTFSFDILNFGNLLNKRWGRINEVGFSSAGGNRRTFVNYGGLNAQGKYIYIVGDAVDDVQIRQVKGESQWALQMTVRYEF